MSSAVVFAYHNVGVRCLAGLLALGVDVKLVVTHQDNPNEQIWFGSVAKLAAEHGIEVITPESPNTPEVIAKVAACEPDFLFSFYYRHMIAKDILALPKRGAFNMHGSLLPKYRGRVPVNWAIIHGESETGATLHVMNEKPDNGALVGQFAVPILPNDTAAEVFDKVTVAAELVLLNAVPKLIAGTAELVQQDLSQGGYFGGRKAEDGRIHWQQSAQQIHNLVRAVTHPFPGAFSELPQGRLLAWRTLVSPQASAGAPALLAHNGKLAARCGDGTLLYLLDATLNGEALTANALNGAEWPLQ
jgi:methionyl-tRNA formyltransferase